MTSGLGWVLAVRLLAPGAGELSEAGRELLDQGMQAYERRDFEAASAAFARGYELDGAPVFLYTRAQAVRYLGDCALAVELYGAFLATDPEPSQRDAALEYRDKCGPSPPEQESPPAPRTVEEVPPPSLSPSTPRASDRPEGRVPPADIAVLTLGVAATTVGVVLVSLAGSAASTQGEVELYERFRDLDRDKRVYLGTGVPLLVIGVVATAVAAVRVHRARSRGATTQARRAEGR